MKLNTLLEYLSLREEDLAPEAPKNSSLGQYLFAPERNDTPEPKEENTGAEQELLRVLNFFYNNGGNAKCDRTLVKLLKLSKQGKYSKLLKPPSGLAYRFIGNLTPEQASKWYLNDFPVKEIISKPGKAFRVSPVGIVSNPAAKSSMGKLNTKLSSWTIDPTLRRMKGFLDTLQAHVGLVLVADIRSNNFFMNPENLIDTLDDDKALPRYMLEDEQEVIGYGPINCLEAAAIYVGEDRVIHHKLLGALDLK